MHSFRYGLLIIYILLGNLYFQSKVLAAGSSIDSTEILMLVNADQGFPFWDSEVNFAKAVADAFSLNLTVHYIPARYRDRFGIVKYIEGYLKKRNNSPDLVMSAFYLGSEDKLLTLLDKKSIPFFSLNSYISTAQYKVLGKPREKFTHWIGHIAPNDIKAGKQLMQALLKIYRQRNHCDQTVCGAKIFGFTGLPYAAVSQQRVKGVEEAVAIDRTSDLYNNVAGNWRKRVVLEKMAIVLQRHKDIDVFWAASDNMAWGIVEAMQLHPNARQSLIGSFDWSPDTIPMIKGDKIQISLGGHFLEAGLALILYYDYLNGIDFSAENGPIIESQMSELTLKNIKQLGPFLIKPIWKKNVLFGYSKFNNPNRTHYLFDPNDIISQQINK